MSDECVPRIARNGTIPKGDRMAHFYGNLKGSRGEATRCGTRQSGIRVSARSWAGSVTVEMEDDDDYGEPRVIIRCGEGSTVSGTALYCGPLSGLVSASKLIPVSEV